MKDTAMKVAAAVLSAGCFAVSALGQSIVIRPSYSVIAPEPLKVFENSSKCLPGRGGPGDDPLAARVEIRAVKYGPAGIVPLSADKKSDETANPLVKVSRIGAGVVGSPQPGRFSVDIPKEARMNVVTNNATADNYRGFFARVYDAPTVDESNYYIDSQLAFYNPSVSYTNLVFAKSMTPIGGGADLDTDGDGLTDQEEAVIGTDYTKADTDGDGVDDFWETAFGLDPLNPPTISAMTANRDEPTIDAILPDDSAWHVEWPASTNPGVRYTLEFVQDVGDWGEEVAEGEESPVKEYAITNAITQTNWAHDVTPWMSEWTRGFIRLRQELDKSVFSDPAASEAGQNEGE